MLAVTLLTVEPYWQSASIPELVADIENAPLAPPSARWGWLPRAFDAWFARSTQRVPEKRWRSVAEQADALEQALKSARPGRGKRSTGPLESASTLVARTPTPVVTPILAGERQLIGRRAELAALEERLRPGAIVTIPAAERALHQTTLERGRALAESFDVSRELGSALQLDEVVALATGLLRSRH